MVELSFMEGITLRQNIEDLIESKRRVELYGTSMHPVKRQEVCDKITTMIQINEYVVKNAPNMEREEFNVIIKFSTEFALEEIIPLMPSPEEKR